METFDHSMEYAEYSDKSFMIYGETKEHKDALKELGGKFNMNLNNPDGSGKTPGWIFPKSKETVVKNFLNTGTISGNFPKAEAKIPNKPVTREEFESLKRRVREVEMNPAITRTKCECPVCVADPVDGPTICSIKPMSERQIANERRLEELKQYFTDESDDESSDKTCAAGKYVNTSKVETCDQSKWGNEEDTDTVQEASQKPRRLLKKKK